MPASQLAQKFKLPYVHEFSILGGQWKSHKRTKHISSTVPKYEGICFLQKNWGPFAFGVPFAFQSEKAMMQHTNDNG